MDNAERRADIRRKLHLYRAAPYTPQERAADRVAAWVLSCAIAAVLVSLAVLGCAIVYSRLPVSP